MLSARVLSIEGFFKLGIFVPASVQRDYVWDAQQSEDLLNDIERACSSPIVETDDNGEIRISLADEGIEEETGAMDGVADSAPAETETIPGYHLGGIVLRRLANNNFEIFDGLQRATTLTILLCVVRDLTNSPELRKRIEATIKAGTTHRITLPGPDTTLLNEIQTDEQTVRSFRRAVSARGARIRTSRSLFHGYLRTWDQERLSRFAAFLLERTIMVMAETENQALARQVFITANDRGVFLRPIDIFKGQILYIAGSEEAATEAGRRWEEILEIVGDDIETFMQAFDFIQRRDPQGPDHLAKLADHIEKNYGAARILAAMDDIKDYASAWKELGTKFKQTSNPVVDPDIWKLRFFKWFEWKPLALAWFKEYRDNRSKTRGGAGAKADNAFRVRFAALHRVCMVATLAKFSAADRAKIFGNAISQWRAKRDPLSIRGQRPGALTFPAQQLARVAESLGTPLYDEETRLSLLRWIEASLAAENVHPDVAFASVEHVLPQRPGPKSQWIQDFPDEEERFSACHSIGNLAIMDYGVNFKIMNGDFKLKRAAIQEQAKKYKTLADIAACSRWTAEAIRKRADTMIRRVWEELQIPRPKRS